MTKYLNLFLFAVMIGIHYHAIALSLNNITNHKNFERLQIV